MKILVCDIHVRLEGHNLGHVQQLLHYLETHPNENEYIFLFNPVAATIPSVQTKAKNIKIIFFTEEEFAPYLSGESIHTATMKVWKHIEKYVQKYQAERMILLMMDMFQHTIGLCKLPIEISGILFNPYPRLVPSSADFKEVIKHKLAIFRKYLTVRFMARNKNIKKIFIFNDHSTVQHLNQKLNTKVFTYLSDPVLNYPNADAFLTIREKHKIAPDRIIYLAFGMIDAKKNVATIIEAATLLPAEGASKLCILVVGKVKDDYQIVLEKAMENAQKYRPELQIEQEKRFVTDPEMESYVRQSDVISLAYVNFYSSSGVIGLSARHNKPILATKFGVVGEQTHAYELGITVDARKKEDITEALKKFINPKTTYPHFAQKFVEDHSPEKYVTTLFEL